MNEPKILKYLALMNEQEASDLYLTVGFPASLRIDDQLEPVSDDPLTIEDIQNILSSILTNKQSREFDEKQELNASLDAGKFGRYRINVLQQRQFPALVVRRIISRIPGFEELGLPKLFEDLALKKRGLILVTGMTGSGKTTTLASMIDYRNAHEEGHIITIEDPIEYFHDHKKSVVTQREVGVDTESFDAAMKNALRQRPDVILIGEIRDMKVMEQALLVAETGHLCLASLHTANAYQSVERVVNMFPKEAHNQIRLTLAMNLQAIVSQRLVHSSKGNLVLANEIMLNQGLVKELIHSGQIGKIRAVIEKNNAIGMCSFDQSLFDLYRQGIITEKVALHQADQPGDLKIHIQQFQMGKETDVMNEIDTSVLKFSE